MRQRCLSKAIERLNQTEFSACNEVEATDTGSSFPSSNNQPGALSTQASAPHTPVSGTRLTKKRALNGSNQDDDEPQENGKKKQKEADEPNVVSNARRLSCPFRKHSPTKFGLGNTRYHTCAIGSWKDISSLK